MNAEAKNAAFARRAHRAGDFSTAARLYRTALEENNYDSAVRHDYAVLLMQMGQHEDAAELLEGLSAEERPSLDSMTVLALCLRRAKRYDEAIVTATRALLHAPESAIFWFVKGACQHASGDSHRAVPNLMKCVSLSPDLFEAWHFLGEALQAAHRPRDAIKAYQIAMRRQQSEVFNIGICLEQLGEVEEARKAYEAMRRLHPERIDCLVRLTHAESLCCMLDNESARQAEIASKSLEAEIRDDVAEAFPLSYMNLDKIVRSALLKRYTNRVLARAPRLNKNSAPIKSERRFIRIGYISPDFGDHAVGHLVQDIFASHDRDQFKIFGYSLKRHDGLIARKIERSFDIYSDCSAEPDAAVAEIIAKDQIDVLIDLAGYTQGSRPEILAARPAQRQLGWLGFIDSHDAPWLDGIILDEFLSPQNTKWWCPDRVIKMKGICFPGGRFTEGTPDRHAFSLPNDSFIFASFNNSYKISHDLISSWVEIIQEVEDSLLAIFLPNYARSSFASAWKRLGGKPESIIILDKLDLASHANRAASCDLFLDAFRYQAGATALASIAAGLPILTMEGERPLSRLSSSINRFLGIEDLLCRDRNDYISKAIHLGKNRDHLFEIRRDMRNAVERTGLFDPLRITREIESICRAVSSNEWSARPLAESNIGHCLDTSR